MGFVMADVRPSLPTVSAGDQRLVLKLLKGHMCLEVSAIAMIDLDDHIRGSQIRFHQGNHGVIAVFLYPLYSNCPFRPRSEVSRARGCHILRSSFFSQGLVGSE
jgi:hypothetical protein